ncbi:unnamed protein product [Vitrella brassicaformis CCMP3155]|uniref:Uncharacterized protein n=1 Tax=Vitrella brassicaformis (strain CCMP3155) TaxID=1169540 RepID=A0A0G4G6Q4_VITBC|nr:unnamed protein product [Vitrella brassicaformis CCMP3155]|eukprot:CEM24392.1 unnamed protein product [Vitrella brassicaformis CCMP3155]
MERGSPGRGTPQNQCIGGSRLGGGGGHLVPDVSPPETPQPPQGGDLGYVVPTEGQLGALQRHKMFFAANPHLKDHHAENGRLTIPLDGEDDLALQSDRQAPVEDYVDMDGERVVLYDNSCPYKAINNLLGSTGGDRLPNHLFHDAPGQQKEIGECGEYINLATDYHAIRLAQVKGDTMEERVVLLGSMSAGEVCGVLATTEVALMGNGRPTETHIQAIRLLGDGLWADMETITEVAPPQAVMSNQDVVELLMRDQPHREAVQQRTPYAYMYHDVLVVFRSDVARDTAANPVPAPNPIAMIADDEHGHQGQQGAQAAAAWAVLLVLLMAIQAAGGQGDGGGAGAGAGAGAGGKGGGKRKRENDEGGAHDGEADDDEPLAQRRRRLKRRVARPQPHDGVPDVEMADAP